jgi:hypothetical protein
MALVNISLQSCSGTGRMMMMLLLLFRTIGRRRRRIRRRRRAWEELEGSVELFGQCVELIGIEESAPRIPLVQLVHKNATAVADSSRRSWHSCMMMMMMTTATTTVLHLRFDLQKRHPPKKTKTTNKENQSQTLLQSLSQILLRFTTLFHHCNSPLKISLTET